MESKDLICKISQTVLSLVHAAIFTSLVVIALDRHHAITKPFQRLRHKPNFLICITAVWGYSIVCAFPHIFTEKITTFIGSNNTYYNHRGVNITVIYRVCAPLSTFKDSVNQKIITTAYFTLGFLLPLAILTVAYSSIAVFLRRKSRNGITMQSSGYEIKRKGITHARFNGSRICCLHWNSSTARFDDSVRQRHHCVIHFRVHTSVVKFPG